MHVTRDRRAGWIALSQEKYALEVLEQFGKAGAFCYLRATRDWKLVFQCAVVGGNTLQGYVDADWATDVNDRKSVSGYASYLPVEPLGVRRSKTL